VAGAAVSPTSRLASILAAADAQKTVHYVSTADTPDTGQTTVGDAGVTQGVQHITFRSGRKKGTVTEVVSARTAFIRGGTLALVAFLDFNPLPAPQYANHWVRVAHTDTAYSSIAAGVTLASNVNELKMTGPLVGVPDTRIDGERVFGLKGHEALSGGSATVTLYARAVGSPLPVMEVTVLGTFRLTATFDRWNESLHVATPAPAVAISKTGLEIPAWVASDRPSSS
jgi:hypothetical protein